MATYAEELARLREVSAKRGCSTVAMRTFLHASFDMVRMIEHQARLLDAARGVLKSISTYGGSDSMAKVLTKHFIGLLDPNQPISEE